MLLILAIRSRRKSETERKSETVRRKIRPCLSVCQTVEENCPYMLPNDRAPAMPTQYAGEPTFLCLGAYSARFEEVVQNYRWWFTCSVILQLCGPQFACMIIVSRVCKTGHPVYQRLVRNRNPEYLGCICKS